MINPANLVSYLNANFMLFKLIFKNSCMKSRKSLCVLSAVIFPKVYYDSFMRRTNRSFPNQTNHPHPPLVLQRSTPMSLYVVALLPNLSVFDLVSSTFIWALSIWSYFTFYFSLRAYSSFFCLSTFCCLWIFTNSNSFWYSASLLNRALANLLL